MSPPSIDQRVVEMQFNNKGFEHGVRDSLRSIENLKRGLDFRESVNNISSLNDAAKKFSFANMSEGIDKIANKFSTLGIIGITALQNITNRVIDAGLDFGKALTYEQIASGFDKYEQKMNSVQTIMNATGKSLEDVNSYLDKLMWFSDETSYGFSDMAAALSQMTSSGGDIDKLVPLITGVANATAFAGKGAEEFKRVMYNLNQSYASGSLQYMDWRSVELAGAGSKQLQEILIQTGEELGKINKGAVTLANFSSTLSEKWADTEVMEVAFGKFAELSEAAFAAVEKGTYKTASEAIEALSNQFPSIAVEAFKAAQTAKTFTEAILATKDAVSSGWLKTHEIVFGDYVEATELWTEVTDILWEAFASGAESRNELLQAWKEAGGRDDLLDAFRNIVEALEALITPIKEAFREIFPKKTVEDLLDMSNRFKEFTKRLIIGEETAEKVKNAFKGFFAVLKTVKNVLGEVWNIAKKVFSIFQPVASYLFDLAGSFGNWASEVNLATKASEGIQKGLEGVKNVVVKASKVIKGALEAIADAIKRLTGIDLTSFDAFVSSIKKKLEPLEGFMGALKKVIDFVVDLFGKGADLLAKIAKKVGEALANLNLDKVNQLLATGSLSALILAFAKFIASIGNFSWQAGEFVSNINEVLWSVKKTLDSAAALKSNTIMRVAIALLILAGALMLLALIPEDRLGAALAGISMLFAELVGALMLFMKAAKSIKIIKMGQIALQLIMIAVALLILAKAVSELASNEWGRVIMGLAALAALLGMMYAFVKLLSKKDKKFKRMRKVAFQLILLAIAVRILASAVSVMAKLELGQLVSGIIALLAVLAMLVGFMHLAKSGGLSVKDAIAFILLGLAVRLMAGAMEALAKLDPNRVGQAFFYMAGILVAIAAFAHMMKEGSLLIKTGISMIFIAIALMLFAKAIQKLGAIPFDELRVGFVALAGILLLIAAASYLISPDKMVQVGVGLLAISIGLLLISFALKKLGELSFDQILNGLFALGGALLFIVIAVNSVQGALGGAFAILVVAAALLVMAFVMSIFAAMSLDEVLMALVAIAGVLLVVAIAAMAVQPIIVPLLLLAAALLILGVAFLAIGAASILLGIGLSLLAAAGWSSVGILLTLAAALVVLSLTSPLLIVLGVALLVLSVGILALGGAIFLLAGAMGLIVALGTEGTDALLRLADTASQIAMFALDITEAAVALLLFGVGAAVAGAGAIVAGVGLMMFAFAMKEMEKVDLNALDGMSALGSELLKASLKLLLAAPGLSISAGALLLFGIGALSAGLGLQSIVYGFVDVVNTVKQVPDLIKDGMVAIIASTEELVDSVIQVFDDKKPNINKAADEFVYEAVKSMNLRRYSFENAGQYLAMGVVAGMKSQEDSVAEQGEVIARTILGKANNTLEIKSPSKAFGRIGKFAVMGFVRDFKKFTPLAVAAADEMAKKTIRPVIDMSDDVALSTDNLASSFKKIASDALDVAPTIVTEQHTTVHHEFDPLRIEGVNDKKQFVAAADYAFEEILAKMMRRQSRV